MGDACGSSAQAPTLQLSREALGIRLLRGAELILGELARGVLEHLPPPIKVTVKATRTACRAALGRPVASARATVRTIARPIPSCTGIIKKPTRLIARK
jgi:hypothetical protein